MSSSQCSGSGAASCFWICIRDLPFVSSSVEPHHLGPQPAALSLICTVCWLASRPVGSKGSKLGPLHLKIPAYPWLRMCRIMSSRKSLRHMAFRNLRRTDRLSGCIRVMFLSQPPDDRQAGRAVALAVARAVLAVGEPLHMLVFPECVAALAALAVSGLRGVSRPLRVGWFRPTSIASWSRMPASICGLLRNEYQEKSTT